MSRRNRRRGDLLSLIRKLNHEYFGDKLSPDVRALLEPVSAQRIEVQHLVTRMFRQMHRRRTHAR